MADKYSIDRKRLYTTGQSGGTITSIALDFTYPRPLRRLLPRGGPVGRPLPGQAAGQAEDLGRGVAGGRAGVPGDDRNHGHTRQGGAKISRAVWNGQLTPGQFAPYAAAMRARKTPVNFVALKKGTVVWPGLEESSVDNHVCTWRAAYTIEGIRDWLFEQKR
ncbi:hypothetical protein ACRAWF_39525 [Streptomyces sp. L7]